VPNKNFALLVLFLCLSLAGLAFVPLLTVKLFPTETLPTLTVRYSMRGQSARVVEQEATAPLEALLSRVKGVRKVSSVSDQGSGRITLDFDKHTDLQTARFEVSMLIRQIWSELPDEVGYPQIDLRYAEREAGRALLSYTVNANLSPLEIQQYTEEHIVPRLTELPGVADVTVNGATPYEWQLTYDNDQLRALGLTPADLQTAVQEHYRSTSVQDFLVVGEGDAERFEPDRISVATAGGRQVPLSTLVRMEHVESRPSGYYRINGLNAIYLSVTAAADANQMQVGQAVQARLSELMPLLPAGFELHLNYDAGERIRTELSTVVQRTLWTLLILLLFVWVVSRSGRYLWLIVSGLVVNLATAFILYYALGLEIQIYSLAGITVSLSLMIDNLIMMADHYARHRSRTVFLPMLAATLTSIGALSVVFLLGEKERMNLMDFAVVIMINLALSLLVALFYIPAYMERCDYRAALVLPRPARLRRVIRWNRGYGRCIDFMRRRRVWICVAVILIFGGTLWLFAKHSYARSYHQPQGEPVLQVAATLPTGSTLEQIDNLIRQMEARLSRDRNIRQFETSVDVGQAFISIYFTPEHQRDGYPYTLKAELTNVALQLGGGSWSVYGLEDQGFSNDVREHAGAFRIKMYGYNYDELLAAAERLRTQLLTHKRIAEVDINDEYRWYKTDNATYYLDLNREALARNGQRSMQVVSALAPTFGRDIVCGRLWNGSAYEQITLRSAQAETVDVWGALHQPVTIGSTSVKVGESGSLVRRQAPMRIVKERQQYRLCLQFEYIGSATQGERVVGEDLKVFCATLPMGYTAEREESAWRPTGGSRQLWLLLYVLGIIFWIACILFDSFRVPLLVLSVIPFSFIGVFLTFYGFRINFDQGGFASLVLLCGITVNAALYILSDYRGLRRRRPHLRPERAYLKAWNRKIVPISLTVLSTILGFIPFLVDNGTTTFWSTLAAGTIGGLLASMVGLWVALPMFLSKKR
jgi:multidrug efflux pump subunit AcrB